MKLRSPAGIAAGLLATAVLAAPAAAAPVTVDLRIEGPGSTLFEGPVTTDVRPFQFSGDPAQHQCDGTTVGGTSPQPVPTRGAALMATGLPIEGGWHPDFGPSFAKIAGVSVGWDGSRFLTEYENHQATSFGACGDPIQPGDRLLFAFGTGSEPLLALAGPATVVPDQPFTVRVTDARTGQGYGGADVGGTTTTTDGTATVGPLGARGPHRLKASDEGVAIRSNALDVCVTDGADGACGTVLPSPPDTTAPTGTILGIKDGQRFSRRRAPRELRGTVTADPSGLWAVKIRLTRRLGRTCWYFSGTREAFLKRTCGKKHAFKVGQETDWSYLLPSRLKRGRYVLDLYAIDNRFNKGVVSRVTFRVR